MATQRRRSTSDQSDSLESAEILGCAPVQQRPKDAGMTERTYAGGCHCGRVRFEVTTELDRASQCNCSLCTKKAYVHHMVAADAFRLLAGADDLATYRFGTGHAQHHFCRACGVAPFFRPRANPSRYMVNVRCLDDVDLASLPIAQFDGRSWESRPDAPYTGPWRDKA